MGKPLLKEIRFEIIQKCNLNCKYCYVDKITKSEGTKELSFEEIKKAVQEAMKQGLEAVSITGGEPLLRYDLVKQVIKFCSDKKLKTGILTNGTLSDENKIKELKKLGLTWIRISLDGSNQKVNSFCRSLSDFNKIVDTIKFSKEHNLYTIVRTTAGDKNKEDLLNVIKLAISLKADRIDIQPIYPTNNKELDKEFMLHLKDHKKITKELLKFRRKVKDKIDVVLYHNWFEFISPEYRGEPVYFSSCGRTFCFIDALGNIKTCGPNSKVLGNIRKDGLLDVWDNQDFLIELRKNKAYGVCKGCNRFSLCLNSCPAATYNLYKDLAHSPPLCPRVRESEEGFYE